MVTGGAGFVGSHLVEALLDEGEELHVFDRVPLASSMNLAAVRNHPGLNYVEGDIRDADALRKFYRPDAGMMFHLAAVSGVKNYLADPLSVIDVVVGGTRTVVELARAHGTKLVFASSSEIYGKNPRVPWPEDGDRVQGPTSVDRWSYSSSKAVCEHMFYGAQRQSGLPFSIVRFFNVYGPRQHPHYVISQSIHKALRGEPPLCYDDGRQTRCFTFIDDIVQGLLKVGRSAKAVGEALNLGHPKETTIREAIETVLDAVDGELSWTPFDTAKEYGGSYQDIPRRVPCVTKAEELLGWKAAISLAEGVARTVSWARENEWWLAD